MSQTSRVSPEIASDIDTMDPEAPEVSLSWSCRDEFVANIMCDIHTHTNVAQTRAHAHTQYDD